MKPSPWGLLYYCVHPSQIKGSIGDTSGVIVGKIPITHPSWSTRTTSPVFTGQHWNAETHPVEQPQNMTEKHTFQFWVTEGSLRQDKPGLRAVDESQSKIKVDKLFPLLPHFTISNLYIIHRYIQFLHTIAKMTYVKV